MKNTLYLITTVLLITTGCKSVQKMVDRGDYEQAILYATEKLAGKKKKTKYVRALEQAYAKTTEQDMARLRYLHAKNDPATWTERYKILEEIANRQAAIAPLLPLISSEGYRASFELIDTETLSAQAAQGAAAHHYHLAEIALEPARTGDVRAARDAYAELRRIDRYFSTYKDKELLKKEAHQLGIMHVYVSIEDDVLHALGLRSWESQRHLRQVRDHFWTKYHTSHSDGQVYHRSIQLKYGDVHTTPEREYVDRYDNTITKQREVDRVDSAGNAIRDTSGNILKDVVEETYRASIVDITRTKKLTLVCDAVQVDYATGQIIMDERLEVVNDFESKAYTYSGDREALPENIVPRLYQTLETFPSDWQMSRDAMDDMSLLFRKFVSKCR